MELKAEELRIGNLVFGKDLGSLNESIGKVKVQAVTPIMMLNVYRYSAIPLDKKWLIKLGFKKDNYGLFYISISKDQYLWVKHYKKGWSVSIDFGDNMKELIDTNFVHSLQNLYYALTNKELI